MGKCLDCKHLKSFKYGYGCDKKRQIIYPTEKEQDCFETNVEEVLKDLFKQARKGNGWS